MIKCLFLILLIFSQNVFADEGSSICANENSVASAANTYYDQQGRNSVAVHVSAQAEEDAWIVNIFDCNGYDSWDCETSAWVWSLRYTLSVYRADCRIKVLPLDANVVCKDCSR